MAQANNMVHVDDYNFDVAVLSATNRQGDGRLGWADYINNKACVSTREYKFPVAGNSEHQAGAVTLIASRIAYLLENTDLTGKNILMVVPDSVAPRVFEAKKVINSMQGEDFEAVHSAVVSKIVKDWMTQDWMEALDHLATVMVAAVEGGVNIDGIKKSELHERMLIDCYDVKEGDKITVLKGGYIDGHEGARTSGYVKPGEYTVIDRSYESKDGIVPQFAISRWENAKAGNKVTTLIKLNEQVSEALPQAKVLDIEIEA